MFAALIPALISAAASIGSSMISNAGAKSRMDQMNAYNSPVQQMARYGQAGLNPNLIYSQGGAGLQSSPAQFVSPEIDPIKIWSSAEAVKESRTRQRANYWKSRVTELLADYQQAKNHQMIDPDGLGDYTTRMGINAHYQTAIMRQQIHKTAAQVQNLEDVQKLMKADLDIKRNVIGEKQYYNLLRQYGIEKGDNPFYRMGSLILNKYVPQIRVR